MEEDITSLTHTKWRCQYHLVFAPKYRRKIIYGKYKLAIGKILRRIIERIEGAEIRALFFFGKTIKKSFTAQYWEVKS